MCFFIPGKLTKSPRKPKIAEKDIPVVKRLERYRNQTTGKWSKWVSYFQYKPYRVGVIYKVDGFGYWMLRGEWTINEGLHSGYAKRFSDIDSYSRQIRTVNAIIPKGSQYYYNPEDREYVSNQLMVVSFKPIKQTTKFKIK